MFQPAVLHPEPDPLFVRQLRKIDTNLRVVWGYERYLRQNWVIERRLDSDRYYKLYGSLFRENLPRFVAQPVYDSNQPLYDEAGELIGYRQVGERQYDLAPDPFAPTRDQRHALHDLSTGRSKTARCEAATSDD